MTRRAVDHPLQDSAASVFKQVLPVVQHFALRSPETRPEGHYDQPVPTSIVKRAHFGQMVREQNGRV